MKHQKGRSAVERYNKQAKQHARRERSKD